MRFAGLARLTFSGRNGATAASEASLAATDTRAPSVGRLLCLGGAALGALGLSAWIAGMPFLTALVPRQPWMMPNTALALFLIGVAGALRNREGVGGARRMLSVLAACVVLGLGVATLAEYVLRTDFHVDRLLLQLLGREDTKGPYPGRPSPPTALAVALLSAGLLLFDFRPRARARPSEWLILSAFFTAFVALVGFAYGAGALYRLAHGPVTGVALPTAVALLVISVGLLLERPHAGVMRVATSPGAGGMMLRRLAMPAFLAPVLLGPVVTQLLIGFGMRELPVLVATLSIAMTAVTLVLLTITAIPLNRAQEVLEAGRTRIRDLVEQAPEGIFIADLDGRFTDVNGAGCRMLGFSREEIVGKTIVDIIPSGEVERLEQEKEKLLEGSTVVSEWKLRRKDGTWLPVEVSARILADGRWQGFARDMTEHKRVEREEKFLGEVASVLASTLDYEGTLKNLTHVVVRELADVCIVQTVEDGHQAPRIHVAHRDPGTAAAAEALRTWPLDARCSLLGLSVIDTGKPLVMSNLGRELPESAAIAAEQRRALRELGAESLLALPLLAHGRVMGSMVLIGTNATRRFGADDLPLAMEVARRAAWAVENARLYRTALRATEARDELLGIVAHDLRNPLGTILMQAALIRRSEARLALPLLEPVEGIERAATRMSRLIDDLLDLTSIEAGYLSVERDRVQVDRLLSDCVKAQRPFASAALLELRLQAEQDIPEVLGDRDRLLQVFENLIGNAIKFASPGGCITVGAVQGVEEVRFWVTNSGAVIPPEHLPHLFDRFWQARKAERRGAGLGLPIVKGIVEAHGGRVWAESAEGRGNTFTFTIPLAPDATARSAGTQSR